MHYYIIKVYIPQVSLCTLQCCMFRQFHVIIRQFTTNALLSYTRASDCSCRKDSSQNYDVSPQFYISSHIVAVEITKKKKL